jgi:hypothetical protein
VSDTPRTDNGIWDYQTLLSVSRRIERELTARTQEIERLTRLCRTAISAWHAQRGEGGLLIPLDAAMASLEELIKPSAPEAKSTKGET